MKIANTPYRFELYRSQVKGQVIQVMKKSELPLQSDEEVAGLYRALRRAGTEHGFSLDDALNGALGRPFSYGTGYLDNFRKGRIDRFKAAKLYAWLRSQYPLHANDLDADISRLGASNIPEHWETFLKEHGQFGHVRISPFQQQQQQQQVQQQLMGDWEREQKHQQTFPLNLPFRFHFEGQFRDYVVGLQWLRGRWFAMPLGAASIGADLSERGQLAAKDGIQLEDHAFNEPNETGLHRFAFILTDPAFGANIASQLSTDDATTPKQLDELASTLLESRPAAPWTVLRLHVMFVVTNHYGMYYA